MAVFQSQKRLPCSNAASTTMPRERRKRRGSDPPPLPSIVGRQKGATLDVVGASVRLSLSLSSPAHIFSSLTPSLVFNCRRRHCVILLLVHTYREGRWDSLCRAEHMFGVLLLTKLCRKVLYSSSISDLSIFDLTIWRDDALGTGVANFHTTNSLLAWQGCIGGAL